MSYQFSRGTAVPSEAVDSPRVQLQRIISRCSCELYFCYFSDRLKFDDSEAETALPTVRGSGHYGTKR